MNLRQWTNATSPNLLVSRVTKIKPKVHTCTETLVKTLPHMILTAFLVRLVSGNSFVNVRVRGLLLAPDGKLNVQHHRQPQKLSQDLRNREP